MMDAELLCHKHYVPSELCEERNQLGARVLPPAESARAQARLED